MGISWLSAALLLVMNATIPPARMAAVAARPKRSFRGDDDISLFRFACGVFSVVGALEIN